VVNSANPNGKVMKLRSIQWWRLISGGFITLVAIQLVPYGRGHVNPPTTSEPAWDSPATRALAKQACFDCHSNETEWPAYSHVAPASWLVQHDVDEGRAVVNFSDWHRPQEEATEAADEVTEGECRRPFTGCCTRTHASALQTASVLPAASRKH
jgi:Haem-binding domain